MVVNLPPIARLGIAIKTTLVERHNLILADMLDKILEETQCDLELAAVWCVNVKNSLSNIQFLFLPISHRYKPQATIYGQ